MNILSKILVVLIVVALLSVMAYVVWTFKWWIIGGCFVVALVNALSHKFFGWDFLNISKEEK